MCAGHARFYSQSLHFYTLEPNRHVFALDSFKPHLEIPFAGHAYQRMLSYLSRMFERQGTVHTSEPAHRLLQQYRDCKAKLTVELSRTPTLDEIAENLDVSLEKLSKVLPMANPIRSLDAEDEDGLSLHELLSNDSGVTPGIDLDDLKTGIMKAMSSLPETDKIATAFCLEMNLNEVKAETTYSLAGAVDLIKDWTKQRLVSFFLKRVKRRNRPKAGLSSSP